MDIDVISMQLGYEKRFVIMNKDTGEIIDDAQGYGFKTIEGARKSWFYRNRDPKETQDFLNKCLKIQEWAQEHEEELNSLEDEVFYAKQNHQKVNEDFVYNFFDEQNITLPLPKAEFYKFWSHDFYYKFTKRELKNLKKKKPTP